LIEPYAITTVMDITFHSVINMTYRVPQINGIVAALLPLLFLYLAECKRENI
jgi:hypothetical protein